MTAHQQRSSNQVREMALKRRTTEPADRRPVTTALEADPLILQRAAANPGLASPGDILSLQHTYGNRAVTRLVQAKLRVGLVGDHYEQEADRVADQVMSMPAPTSDARSAEGGGRSTVQRQVLEEEEEVQMKPLAASITPVVQRQEMPEEEELLQGKSLVQRRADGGFEASDDIARRIAGRKGSGSPLPDNLQAEMESRFGTDFSAVRVHTDSEAGKLSKDLRARAFTHGTDIYLEAGQYDPGSSDGKRLLAHELTHVVQQTGGQPVGQNDRAASPDGLAVTHTHPQASQGAGVIQANGGNKSIQELLEEAMKKRETRERIKAKMTGQTEQLPKTKTTTSTTSTPTTTGEKRPEKPKREDFDSDDEYFKAVQAYHRPPKEQLEALSSGAQLIRESQKKAPPQEGGIEISGPRLVETRKLGKAGLLAEHGISVEDYDKLGKKQQQKLARIITRSGRKGKSTSESARTFIEREKQKAGRPPGAWKTLKSGWGMAKESLKWGLTSKLLPPGVRLAAARRRALAKRGGETGQPQQLRQGIIREKVGKTPPSPKEPSSEEKTETSGGGGILTLAKDMGGLQSRIETLEKELASLKSTQ
ncbi:MAG: DUF4157 domain-containing protein [Anaerolineae bacterium]